MQPECFLIHWLCGGAWSWLPSDWPVGLLQQVLAQADRQRAQAPVAWYVPLGLGELPNIQGGCN